MALAQEGPAVHRAGAGRAGLRRRAQSRPAPVDPRAQSDLARAAQPAGLRAAQRAGHRQRRARRGGEPAAAWRSPRRRSRPNRTQHHRDVRKDLQEKAVNGHLVRAGQPDPGARLRLRGDRHPLRSAGERPAGPLPDRRPASGHPVRRAGDGHAGDQPAQGHLEPEHRRAPAFAGRPDHDPAPQPPARPAGGDVSRRSSARRSSSGSTRC